MSLSCLHAATKAYTRGHRNFNRTGAGTTSPAAVRTSITAGRSTGWSIERAHQAYCSTAHWAQQVSFSSSIAAASKPMEVEVKIRLPDRGAYDKVNTLLAPGKKVSYAQENYFFDGDKQELESQRAVMRLRLFTDQEGRQKATITVKGKQILSDGIGRASEVEEDVSDVTTARGWLEQPGAMLQASPLLKGLNEKLGISNLRCMGGFKNQREVFSWEGETLELDETKYEHGTLYEIECETTQPEVMRDKLEKFLGDNAISYSYSKTSKFANFINKTLL